MDEITLKVKEMRLAQKRYFRERTKEALVESKRLEAEVDKLLVMAEDEANKPAPGQPELL